MERADAESTEKIVPVMTAASFYRDRIYGGKQHKNSGHPEGFGRLSDRKKFAEKEHARAESELSSARMRVKELSSRIEESNARARARKDELQLSEKEEEEEREADQVTAGVDGGNFQHTELMQELEIVKQELSKLKLDMACVLEAKSKAEKETEASAVAAKSYLSSVEELRAEIEEINGENVLVEVARIEAVRESEEIEARSEAEAAQFSKNMKETKARMEEMAAEIDRAKGLEMKLVVTNSDLDALQFEMELVRVMEKNYVAENGKRRQEEVGSDRLLPSAAKAELEAEKNEMARVEEEGVQFMASMDVVTEELKHLSREAASLKKLEEKEDSTVQNLNSKLLGAKYKLEAATVAEEKAKALLADLSSALQHLQSEMEAAKNEKELIDKETESIQMKINKTELDIYSAEQRLQAAVQELEAVKESEAAALDQLRTLTEGTMRARASSVLHSSTIRISNFEYDYLIGRAEGAQEIADEKVAAALAWVEALKSSEKEIMMKTEIAHREIRELGVAEENDLHRMGESSMSMSKQGLEGELCMWRQQEWESEEATLQLVVAPLRKSLKENGNPTPSRKSKTRRRSHLPLRSNGKRR